MKILYYDCFAGISGDMNLGAMIDLGVDQQYLRSELQKLPVDGYRIEITKAKRHGIEGTMVEVLLDHHSDGDHSKQGTEYHHERNLQSIERIINASSLSPMVRDTSCAIFKKLAEAEAKVHGVSVAEIHFHEVGAVDSIVDIVGAAICLEYLSVDKVLCSTIELGGGFVTCKHGTIPVPAPATVEVLQGVPVKKGAVQHETTTPTGAAILATIVHEFVDQTNFTITAVAHGIGHRESEIPNVLRVFLAEYTEETAAQSGLDAETAVMIECNIDDMNPEWYDYVMEKLFEAGADDVYCVPIIMKKSRPAATLSVLCSPKLESLLLGIIFQETSTLGVRKYPVDKTMLRRTSRTITTRFGDVTVKSGYYNNKIIKTKPEYADCARIAREYNIPLREIYKEIEAVVASGKE